MFGALVKQSATDIGKKLLAKIEENSKETKLLMEVVEELGTANKIKEDEILNAKQKLSEMKSKDKETSEKLEQALKKLSKQSARNVTKREVRRDQKLAELSKSLSDKDKQLTDLSENEDKLLNDIFQKDKTIQAMKEQLDRAIKAKWQEQRMKLYY